jgi:hypothetical protein
VAQNSAPHDDPVDPAGSSVVSEVDPSPVPDGPITNNSPTNVATEPPVPPNALRPWYFREWFLVPTFVWWPCSAVLFIRSPWHNGVLIGTVSWAWIIIGGGWIFLRTQFRMQNGESLVDPTLWALAAPGILLTILTQYLWLARHRPRIRRIRDAGGFADYPDEADDDWLPPPPRDNPPSRRRRANRGSARSRRRRR